MDSFAFVSSLATLQFEMLKKMKECALKYALKLKLWRYQIVNLNSPKLHMCTLMDLDIKKSLRTYPENALCCAPN